MFNEYSVSSRMRSLVAEESCDLWDYVTFGIMFLLATSTTELKPTSIVQGFPTSNT